MLVFFIFLNLFFLCMIFDVNPSPYELMLKPFYIGYWFIFVLGYCIFWYWVSDVRWNRSGYKTNIFRTQPSPRFTEPHLRLSDEPLRQMIGVDGEIMDVYAIGQGFYCKSSASLMTKVIRLSAGTYQMIYHFPYPVYFQLVDAKTGSRTGLLMNEYGTNVKTFAVNTETDYFCDIELIWPGETQWQFELKPLQSL